MLRITAQRHQVIHITDTKKNTKAILTVVYIDKEHNEARLQLSEHDGNVKREFTVAFDEPQKATEELIVHLFTVNKYKSDARNVDYVCLGFQAERYIKIQGEWNIKGNK